MNNMMKTPLAIAVLTAGLMGMSGLVNAESPAQTTTAISQEEVKVSEQKVDQFVTAYVEVQKINKDYSEKLQAADEPAEATELQQEAQTKMQKAVTDSGLTIPEYQQIASLAGQDDQLRSRIESELEN